MIYNYHFKNVFSFAEETEVSFVLNRNAPEINSVFTSPRGVRLSKLMAVQGANGAGKTNALKVLSFLGRFAAHSFVPDYRYSIVPDSHIFSKDEDSEMRIEFEHEGEHYKYQLVVNVNKGGVLHESLYHKTGSSFNYIFRRVLTESSSYSIRQKGFGFAPKEASRVRANASLISTAAQYNVPYAVKLADYFGRISSNIFVIGMDIPDLFKGAGFFYEHPELRGKMVEFMRQVDLGLTDVTIEISSGKEMKTGEPAMAIPWGVHGQGRRKHQLSFWEESSGTRSTFLLLQKILPVLEHGGMMVIDELDAGLHPDMAMALLRLFTDTESNPHHAQIIFTSYLPDVMSVLQKEQILLVEKDPDGCSTAWRLGDMSGIRRDENYYGKYRAGAYGAIPDI